MTWFSEFYKKLRDAGYPANEAFKLAQADKTLTEMCENEDFRVRWTLDPDFELDWDFPSPEDEAVVRKDLEEGRLEALGVVLERCESCEFCEAVRWEQVDSLWGILLSPDDHLTRRVYELGLDF